jgi:dihydroxyacetone kinase DhaKLM complex PTS-EIIA-like component DhaM
MPATIPGLAPDAFQVAQPVRVVSSVAGTGDPRNGAEVHHVQNAWNNLHGGALTSMFYLGAALTSLKNDWSWR